MHQTYQSVFVCHFHNTGELDLQYCPTETMWADVLTKPLQDAKFWLMRAFLMNCPIDYYKDNSFKPISDPTLAPSPATITHSREPIFWIHLLTPLTFQFWWHINHFTPMFHLRGVLRQGLMVLEYQILAVRYLRLPRRKSAGKIPYFHVISRSPFLWSLDLSIEIFVRRSRELLLIILTNISVSNVKSATRI